MLTYNHSTKTVTEVATIKKPDDNDFYEPDWEQPDRIYFDSYSRNADLKKYNEHIAGLRTYPAIGFSQEDEGEVSEKDFRLQHQWFITMYGTDKSQWTDCNEKDYQYVSESRRRIVAIPLPVKEEQYEKEKDDKKRITAVRTKPEPSLPMPASISFIHEVEEGNIYIDLFKDQSGTINGVVVNIWKDKQLQFNQSFLPSGIEVKEEQSQIPDKLKNMNQSNQPCEAGEESKVKQEITLHKLINIIDGNTSMDYWQNEKLAIEIFRHIAGAKLASPSIPNEGKQEPQLDTHIMLNNLSEHGNKTNPTFTLEQALEIYKAGFNHCLHFGTTNAEQRGDEYFLKTFGIEIKDSMEPAVSIEGKEAIEFLNNIRDYERESGNKICYDERSSEELYQIFKSKP